jgi:hypothetical protein
VKPSRDKVVVVCLLHEPGNKAEALVVVVLADL